jgi:carbamoyltransferase
MGEHFLGIFEGGYDPAVGLVSNGSVLAFAEEERFLRNKHAKGYYPVRALKACLDIAGMDPASIKEVAVGWNVPAYTDGRMATYFANMRERWDVDDGTLAWQRGVLASFNESAVVHRHRSAWSKAFGKLPPLKIRAIPHHYAHALQAFLQSPFDDALCITVDGSGDEFCTVLWSCHGEVITPIYEIGMPHSLGWFYAACTEYLGFEAYDGEYKVMGLAAYGKSNPQMDQRMSKVLSAAPDGIGYVVDPKYIHYGKRSWSDRFTDHLCDLFERRPRADAEPIEEWHFDFAFAAQKALEEAALRLVNWGAQRAQSTNLCIGGGVGLNVKMNTRLFEADGIKRIFPHPLCSDSGAAAGVALAACWQSTGVRPERLRTLALGNEEQDLDIEATLKRCRIDYERSDDIAGAAAEELSKGSVVGWFQGRMEAGPRALGQRSILADPRHVAARDKVNAVIKYREPWRPFCPSMTLEAADEYLESWDDASFMIIAFRATEKLKQDAPAVVHVDGTVRVQLVDSRDNPLYHRLLTAFAARTGVPVLLNTSFNVKGEPIVCTAIDAIRTFHGTGMDALAIGSFLIKKKA